MSGHEVAAGTGPHILVIEDHGLVRQFVTLVLRKEGFRVTTGESGEEALRLLEGGLQVDLLLSDIRMPGSVDGVQLARWVRAHRPGMAILLQTGYSGTAVEEFKVLQKPYAPEALLEAIGAALRNARAG